MMSFGDIEMRIGQWFTVAAAALLPISAGAVEAGKNALPDWREGARSHGFAPEDVARLERDKVLITGESFHQVFDAYLPVHPTRAALFITADSLLNAFHVLFEESVQRLEEVNARKLPPILLGILSRLDLASAGLSVPASLLEGARMRARIILIVALRLLGNEELRLDASVEALVRAEVDRITAASAVERPAWLGAPDSGFVAIDYRRFKPRGFYTKADGLER
jgi:uncharacterized protein DUF3160